MGSRAGTEVAGARTDPAAVIHRRQQRVAMAVLVLAWLAFVLPAFTGKARFPVDFAGPEPGQVSKPLANPELGDAFYAFHPWRSYLAERLGAGEIPLWDPYRFAGTPFAADITIGVWYPPNWLYATGNILFTFTLIAVVSILAALFLAYWFFRVMELHPYAAALGAIVFVFSAFMMKWSSNEAVFASAMWLPLALGGLEVARRGRVRRGVLLATAGLSLSILGGHAQIALIVWLAAALWFATGLVASVHEQRRAAGGWAWLPSLLARAAWPVGLAFVLATGLAAVQLLPAAEFAQEIVRQETTFSAASKTALPLSHLPTLLVPDYQGNPVDGNYDGAGVNYTETAVYAGLLTLPLAAFGVVTHRLGRLGAFFLVLLVVAVLAVMGTPFYRVVLAIPGFSRTLFTTRFILLFNFAVAGLAALGLHRLVTRPSRLVMPLAVRSAVVLIVMVSALVLARPGTAVAREYVMGRGLRSVAILLIGTVLVALLIHVPARAAPAALAVVAVVFLDLWMFGSRFNPFHSPRAVHARSPGIEFLAARPGQRPRFASVGSWTVPPNGELQHRLYGVSGYDPFVPRRIVDLLKLADQRVSLARTNFLGPFRTRVISSPILDLLGVTTVVVPEAPARAPLQLDGEFRALKRPLALPPAWVTGCWELKSDKAALAAVSTMTTPELAATAIVADDRHARRALGGVDGGDGRDCEPARPAGSAVVERYDPERVVLRATADQAGVLVLSDAWFAGWEAEVNGNDATVLRVDHALRGVALPAGTHTVEFVYKPASLAVGGAVTATTLAGIIGSLALPALRRRGRRARRTGQGERLRQISKTPIRLSKTKPASTGPRISRQSSAYDEASST